MTEAEITEVLFKRDPSPAPTSPSCSGTATGTCRPSVRGMPLSSSFTDTPRDCYSAAVEPGTADEARPSTWRPSHKRVASLPRHSFSKVSPAPRWKTFPSPSPFSPAKPSSTRYERSISSRAPGTCVAFFTSQTSRSDQAFVFSLHPRKRAAPHRPGHHRMSVGSASLPSSDS